MLYQYYQVEASFALVYEVFYVQAYMSFWIFLLSSLTQLDGILYAALLLYEHQQM